MQGTLVRSETASLDSGAVLCEQFVIEWCMCRCGLLVVCLEVTQTASVSSEA